MRAPHVWTPFAARSIPPARALLWSDEFNGQAGQAIDPSNWMFVTGQSGFGNNEKQACLPGTANCALDGNSNVVITIKNETPPTAYDDPAHRGDPNYAYTSACIQTKGLRTFSPADGVAGVRLVARVRVPVTKGLHSAFWTDGAIGVWPACGEMDIMEFWCSLFDATFPMNLHGPTTGNPTVDKPLSVAAARSTVPYGAGAFRQVGIDWYPDRILWHVDGQIIGVATQAAYEASGGTWLSTFTAPHYLILNTAVGGNAPGMPDGTSVFPATYVVDWVRVYSL